MYNNNVAEIIAAIIITLSILALIVLIALCAHFGRGANTSTTYYPTTPITPIVPHTTHHTTHRIPTTVIVQAPIDHHIGHTSFSSTRPTNVTTTLPGVPVHHGHNNSSSLFTYSGKSGGDFGHGGSVKITSTTRSSPPAHSMNHMNSGPVGHTPSFAVSGGVHHGGGGGRFGKH